jgi:AraC-like DNA-binding protein
MPGKIQETHLSAAPGAWRFAQAAPDTDLAGRVKEFWEVEGALEPFRETLLPSGCVELMVNLGPPHTLLSRQAPGVWKRAWFSGLHEHSLIIESLQGTHLVSARMDPVGAAELLGRGVSGAANTVVDLETFLGDVGRELVESVKSAGSPAERFSVLETFLRTRLSTFEPVPELVHHAAERVVAAHGNLKVSALHEAAGVSRKHLSVSFSRHLGISPKAFAQLHRFVWTLERLRESSTVDWSRLALDAGYSDQSHLVRDFQRVGAASPTEYLRTMSPDGRALLAEPG